MGGEIPVTGATVVALAASGIIAIAFRSWILKGRASAHGCQCTEHPEIPQTLAVGELQEEGLLPANLIVRTNRSLNNMFERDHRRVKQRVKSLLGFKRFEPATLTVPGIELVHQIKTQQFALSAVCAPHVRTPQVWEAALAARAAHRVDAP